MGFTALDDKKGMIRRSQRYGYEEELHKLSCPNHQFYLELELSRPMEKVAEILKKVKCPLCDSKEITMSATAYHAIYAPVVKEIDL